LRGQGDRRRPNVCGEADYDRSFNRGLDMDENEMLALTFAELDAIS